MKDISVIIFISIISLVFLSCQAKEKLGPKKEKYTKEKIKKLIKKVNNKTIDFHDFRPPHLKFALLERNLFITEPPEAVELSKCGEVEVLWELIKLLKYKERAYAANAVLLAMTFSNAKLFISDYDEKERWFDINGEEEYKAWSEWYKKYHKKLKWFDDGIYSYFYVPE